MSVVVVGYYRALDLGERAPSSMIKSLSLSWFMMARRSSGFTLDAVPRCLGSNLALRAARICLRFAVRSLIAKSSFAWSGSSGSSPYLFQRAGSALPNSILARVSGFD